MRFLVLFSYFLGTRGYDIFNMFDIRVEIPPFKCWTCQSTNYIDCSENAILQDCPKMNDESDNTWSCGIEGHS